MPKKKGSKMSPALIKAAIDMVKSMTDLTAKVIDAGDPKKYAESVEKLHSGVDESYALMRSIVENDNSLSTDEKLEKLKQLAEEEQAAKDKCGEALEGHREKTSKIAIDVLQGFLTCGLSFTPAIIKSIKKALSSKEEPELINVESSEPTKLINEESTETE